MLRCDWSADDTHKPPLGTKKEKKKYQGFRESEKKRNESETEKESERVREGERGENHLVVQIALGV